MDKISNESKLISNLSQHNGLFLNQIAHKANLGRDKVYDVNDQNFKKTSIKFAQKPWVYGRQDNSYDE